ncbi:MAG TPA: PAC2 family protein [Acidimicrobiales bacterium]|nr:PAC2 family protein [Acidimicrobiales bacterium]
MEHVRWDDRPRLDRPVAIAAWQGWNDAGEAASGAVRYLSLNAGAERVASIDPEEFHDFTVARPMVRLIDGITRSIDWPTTDVEVATSIGGLHDLVFVHGFEPQLRWRTYCEEVVTIMRALEIEMVLTLGALLADVAYRRPVRVIGTATDAALIERLGLQRSRYEGPTGIVGVLHDALSAAGIPSASLWASVPHYLGQTPSPKAKLALVQRAAELMNIPTHVTDLELASAAYERQVSEAVAENDDLAQYIAQLELADEADDEADEPSSSHADDLAAEVERFLREHGS